MFTSKPAVDDLILAEFAFTSVIPAMWNMISASVLNKGTDLPKCIEIHEIGTTVQTDAALEKGKKRPHRTTFSRQVQFLKK